MEKVWLLVSEFFAQDSLYRAAASGGTILFFLQLLLLFFNGDIEGETDGQFKWLSKQTSIGFTMFFGWVGLTSIHQFRLSPIATFMLAFLAGVAALFVNAFIFRSARKLKSTGTVFRIEDTIGKTAIVYQTIPVGGSGKVTVVLENFTHELEAISDEQFDLPSFSSVQICKIANKNTVIVIPK